MGTKLVTIGPQRLGLFGRLYRALRNTKYGRLLLELTTRTLGSLVLAGLQHPGPLRGPPTAGPTLAMTNFPAAGRPPRHEPESSTARVLSVPITKSHVLTPHLGPTPSVLGRTLPICRRQLPAGICHSASEEGRADLADM